LRHEFRKYRNEVGIGMGREKRRKAGKRWGGEVRKARQILDEAESDTGLIFLDMGYALHFR
jgi:hypothetical protein